MNPFRAAPDTPGLKLRWADGWVEDFPEDEFAEECIARPRRIWMYRPRSKCLEEYSLTVEGTLADLYYGGRFDAANRAPDRDLYIGTTRLRFADESRTRVVNVAWRDEGKKRFVEYDIEASWATDLSFSDASFVPPEGDHRLRGVLSSVLRPGQLRFRAALIRRYGARCLISGVSLEDCLEAAHIMPYRGSDYDHPANGLLLRADLHRLYDRLLISIDPVALTVVLSPALAEPSYQALRGQRLALPKRSRPSDLALKNHWNRFAQRSLTTA